jgi:ferric-dicitrate binding protein FerR (iron transport regulator)
MVAEGPDEAMVDVEEGVVKVNGSADGGGDSSVTLRAGYEARASRGDVSAYPIDVDTVFEWVHQPLTFEGQTIGQAVDAFNVRNRARIVIKDPALAQKTFSGTFYSKDLQKFASVLKARGVEVAITEDSGTPPPTP